MIPPGPAGGFPGGSRPFLHGWQANATRGEKRLHVALAVLANGYSDLFGDYWGDVWRTVNPLFIGSSSVAAVTLRRCGCPAGRVGAVVSVAMGTLVFANGYFVNNEVSGRYWTRCGCLRHWSGPPAPASPTSPHSKAVSRPRFLRSLDLLLRQTAPIQHLLHPKRPALRTLS